MNSGSSDLPRLLKIDLDGATVYWQAIVASPARFTNLEITTRTNL